MATALALIVVAGFIPLHDPGQPLRVAVGLWPGSETLLEAQEKGLLPESRFVFLEATWPSAAYRAFDNHAVDAAILAAEDVGRLRSGGEEVRVVCYMDESRGADALVGGEEVASIGALKGKRIGVSAHGPGRRFLAEALASAGLSDGDVVVVTLLEPEIPEALGSGTVSAVVAAEPWLDGILLGGGRILMDSSQTKTPIHRLLVVQEATFREGRDALVELIRAHLEVAPLLSAPAARKDAVPPKRRRVSPESFADMMARIRIFDLAANLELMRAAGGEGADWLDDSLLREVPK